MKRIDKIKSLTPKYFPSAKLSRSRLSPTRGRAKQKGAQIQTDLSAFAQRNYFY
jgi:hypothetical protein